MHTYRSLETTTVYLHENNVVETDRIERVESCEATLNPVCFDHALKDVLESDALALACQVVHDSEDSTEFVRRVCTFNVLTAGPPLVLALTDAAGAVVCVTGADGVRAGCGGVEAEGAVVTSE